MEVVQWPRKRREEAEEDVSPRRRTVPITGRRREESFPSSSHCSYSRQAGEGGEERINSVINTKWVSTARGGEE